jgi:hypothetical protein
MLVGVPQVFENLMIGIRRAVSDSPPVKRLLFRMFYGLSAALYRVGIPAGRALFVSLRRKAGMTTLRHMVSGGAALPPEIERGRSVDVEAEIKQVVDAYNDTAPAYRRIRQWKIRDGEFQKTSTRKIRRYLYSREF